MNIASGAVPHHMLFSRTISPVLSLEHMHEKLNFSIADADFKVNSIMLQYRTCHFLDGQGFVWWLVLNPVTEVL